MGLWLLGPALVAWAESSPAAEPIVLAAADLDAVTAGGRLPVAQVERADMRATPELADLALGGALPRTHLASAERAQTRDGSAGGATRLARFSPGLAERGSRLLSRLDTGLPRPDLTGSATAGLVAAAHGRVATISDDVQASVAHSAGGMRAISAGNGTASGDGRASLSGSGGVQLGGGGTTGGVGVGVQATGSGPGSVVDVHFLTEAVRGAAGDRITALITAHACCGPDASVTVAAALSYGTNLAATPPAHAR
jgi:hypothetical protein